jgi:hypothetical protein
MFGIIYKLTVMAQLSHRVLYSPVKIGQSREDPTGRGVSFLIGIRIQKGLLEGRRKGLLGTGSS